MSLEHEAILPSTLDPITTDAHNIVAFDSTTSEARRITTETTLTNSDTKTPTSGAVYDYVAQYIASIDAMVYKGVQDCSTNPNYPAGDAGHTYRVSVAGKIGGASGINVEVGDLLLCNTDGTASGNQATVGAYWNIIQTNLDGAVTMSANAGATDEIILSAGANKTQKTSGKSIETIPTNSDNKLTTSKFLFQRDGGAGSVASYYKYFEDLTQRSITLTKATWFQAGSATISLEAGTWEVEYDFYVFANVTGGGSVQGMLSTSTTPPSSLYLTAFETGSNLVFGNLKKSFILTVGSTTSYNFYVKCESAGTLSEFFVLNSRSAGTIKAKRIY